jgi:hypothetical protein
MPPRSKLLVVFSIFLLACMGLMFLCIRPDLHPFSYSYSLSFRLQTEALLQGRLAISDKISDYIQDWALTDSGWHQIWGLGIPLLRLPFDLASKLWSLPGFPDLLFATLFMALCATALFSSLKHYFTAPNPHMQAAVCFCGAICLVLPVSTVWLVRCWNVYHEAVFFSTLWSMLIVAVALTPRVRVTRKHWLMLVGLCAFQSYLRPTGLAYSAIIIGFFGMYFWRHLSLRLRLAGLCFFAASQCGLLGLNAIRFGDAFDFGHGMNIPPFAGIGLAQRFGLALPDASWGASIREAIGSAFQGEPYGTYWLPKASWQAPIQKYRQLIYTPFGTWDGLALLLAAAVAAFSLKHMPEARVTFLCLLCGFILLILFYARLNALASRYFSDLAACIMTGWLVVSLAIWQRIQDLKNYLQLPCQAVFLLVICGAFALSLSDVVKGKANKTHRQYLTASGLEAAMASFASHDVYPIPAEYRCSKDTYNADIMPNLSRWAYAGSCTAYDFTAAVLASTPCVTYHAIVPAESMQYIIKNARVKSNREDMLLRRWSSNEDRLDLEYCLDKPLKDVGFRQVVIVWEAGDQFFRKTHDIKLQSVRATFPDTYSQH